MPEKVHLPILNCSWRPPRYAAECFFVMETWQKLNAKEPICLCSIACRNLQSRSESPPPLESDSSRHSKSCDREHLKRARRKQGALLCILFSLECRIAPVLICVLQPGVPHRLEMDTKTETICCRRNMLSQAEPEVHPKHSTSLINDNHHNPSCALTHTLNPRLPCSAARHDLRFFC
jgi:hypothetical protein